MSQTSLPSSQILTTIFIGDLVGKPGQMLFEKWGMRLREQYGADLLVVNGENSANNGRGITPSIVKKLYTQGADVITTGNHVWGQRAIYDTFSKDERIIRPINFPASCPGKGYVVVRAKGELVAIANAQGRVFMHEKLACPFRTMESALTYLSRQTPLIFLDFHAEATSEKQGMGFFLDGKITGLVGTHTHVQTADEHILPKGTAYISDLGCCASMHSMLGMKKDIILERFLTQMPVRFAVEHNGPFALHGVCIKADMATGKALSIERIRIIDEELVVGVQS